VGVATTFVNDKDEPMFDYLIKILLESGQDLPDFWQERKPEEGVEVDFNDNSDDENEAGGEGNGGNAAADDAWV
jgi:ATP-dependent RNA helicase DDX3X